MRVHSRPARSEPVGQHLARRGRPHSVDNKVRDTPCLEAAVLLIERRHWRRALRQYLINFWRCQQPTVFWRPVWRQASDHLYIWVGSYVWPFWRQASHVFTVRRSSSRDPSAEPQCRHSLLWRPSRTTASYHGNRRPRLLPDMAARSKQRDRNVFDSAPTPLSRHQRHGAVPWRES